MKGITQKHYQNLILQCADNSNYSDEMLVFDNEKIAFMSATVRLEMQWRIDQAGLQTACLDWLQGLASGCTIPFYNGHIIEWAESIIGKELTEKQSDTLLKEYWICAANALTVMINQWERKQ